MVQSYRNFSKDRFSVGELIFGALIVLGLAAAWTGYSVMILCGILWGEFQWLAPIGFIPATGIAVFGGVLLGVVGSGLSVSKS